MMESDLLKTKRRIRSFPRCDGDAESPSFGESGMSPFQRDVKRSEKDAS